MEEMNYEIMQMIDDLQQMRYHQKTIGVEEAKKDRYGYAFEPLDTFSTEPLGFTETAMRLQAEAGELFRLICKVSRFSPLFIRMSGQFEKMVNQLGSCCITKAVMEQQGDTFDLLEMLTIDKLRGWTALNFRKSYAAFMDSHADGRYKPAAFDLSVRWAALDRRLLATAEKIEKIRSGKLNIDIAEKEPPAEPKDEYRENNKEQSTTSPFTPKSASLPIDRTAIRGTGKQSHADILEKSPDDPGSESVIIETNAEKPQPGAVPEILFTEKDGPDSDGEGNDEKIMRDILLADAIGRGDRDAYEASCSARGAELAYLWEQFMQRDAENDFSCLKRLGFVVEKTDPPPWDDYEDQGIGIKDQAMVPV